MKKSAIILLTFLIVLFSGCKAPDKETDNKNTIAVSIPPQATFVNKVSGDKFNIVTAIPAGASPETYEPTPAEIKAISNAEIYFSIGVPAEENSILPIVNEKAKTIALHKKTQELYPELTVDGHRDPHIWLSPKRVIVMVSAIADALKQFDPENAEFYSQNAKSYIEELKRLDGYITSSFENLNTRKFMVFHSAFGYFADDYSLLMYAIEEHGKEASAKRLASMADIAKEENIKVIFYQAEASKKQALSFAEEIGGEVVMLEPLASDYTENLKKMTNSLLKAMK